MLKRAAILAAFASLLIATAGYAPCEYPHSRHQDYWQYHVECTHNPCQGGDAYVDWWSLDGTCDTDCEGYTTCDGDTHIDSRTDIETTLGYCAPICE